MCIKKPNIVALRHFLMYCNYYNKEFGYVYRSILIHDDENRTVRIPLKDVHIKPLEWTIAVGLGEGGFGHSYHRHERLLCGCRYSCKWSLF